MTVLGGRLSGPRLPCELFEQIVELIDRDDPSALKSCSLASHILSFLSQRRIFREIHLTRRKSDTFQQFYQLLKDSSHIAEYVLNLRIDSDLATLCLQNHCLASTLPLLRRLRNFEISSAHVRGDLLRWHRLDKSTEQALLDVLALPSITHIDITGIRDFPPEKCFDFSPALRHLSLPSLTFSTSKINPLSHLEPNSSLSSPPTGIIPNRPILDSLAFVDAIDNGLTLRWFSSPSILSPVDISHLQSLKLAFMKDVRSSNYISTLNADLKVFSHSLEQLRFNVIDRNTTHSLWSEPQGWASVQPWTVGVPPPDISILTSLSSLTIDSKVIQYPRNETPRSYSSPLPWIASLLSKLTDIPLKTLILNISIAGITQSVLKNIDWNEISDLVAHQIFLRGVALVLSDESHSFLTVTPIEYNIRCRRVLDCDRPVVPL